MSEDFSKLPYGWHYGEGGPIKQEVCALAERWSDYAKSLGLSVEQFPGVNNNILLSIYKDNGDVVELEIKEDLSIDLFYEMSDTGLDYNNYNASGTAIEELINHK